MPREPTATGWSLGRSWPRATRATPGGSGTCRFLTIKLGDVAVAQGKLDDAARAYGDGLVIAKKLAAGDPSNTQWQRDLSVSFVHLGDVAVAQGKLDDAAQAYSDGLASFRRSWWRATPPTPTGSGTSRFPTIASVTWRWRKASWRTPRRPTATGWRFAKQLVAGDPSNTQWQRDLRFPHRAWRRGGGPR